MVSSCAGGELIYCRVVVCEQGVAHHGQPPAVRAEQSVGLVLHATTSPQESAVSVASIGCDAKLPVLTLRHQQTGRYRSERAPSRVTSANRPGDLADPHPPYPAPDLILDAADAVRLLDATYPPRPRDGPAAWSACCVDFSVVAASGTRPRPLSLNRQQSPLMATIFGVVGDPLGTIHALTIGGRLAAPIT